MTDNAAVRFFHVWDTYAKVVAANYMFHRELGDGVRRALAAAFGEKPVSVLDLGCGDAATFAPLLQGRALKRYIGADLSAAALDIARTNLAALPCPVDLQRADFANALAAAPSSDVIYISFALHHLPTAQKADFFRLAAQKLAPGGLLLLVDVMREEGESLADYHPAYCGYVRETMTALDASEREEICAHIANYDFPEAASTLEAQAGLAGLRRLGSAAPHRHHRLLVFGHA
jgi:SAM-dependent methyltransferase